MFFRLAIALAALVALPRAAEAQGWTPVFSAGPSISTLGIGASIGAKVNEHVGIRVDGSWLGFDFHDSPDDLDYKAKIHLASLGALADVFPFGGGFHLTGGIRIGDHRGDLQAQPSGPVSVGGTTYLPGDLGTVDGKIRVHSFAPYLGVGYTAAFWDDKLEVGVDAGVLYQGRARVQLSSSGALSGTPGLEADLEQEEDDLRRDLQWLEFYPVVALSLRYRF